MSSGGPTSLDNYIQFGHKVCIKAGIIITGDGSGGTRTWQPEDVKANILLTYSIFQYGYEEDRRCSSQLSTWIFDGFVPTWKYDKEGKIIPPAALPRLNRYEKKSSAAAVILSPCQIMGIWSARGHFGCGLRRWIHTLCERFHNLHHLQPQPQQTALFKAASQGRAGTHPLIGHTLLARILPRRESTGTPLYHQSPADLGILCMTHLLHRSKAPQTGLLPKTCSYK